MTVTSQLLRERRMLVLAIVLAVLAIVPAVRAGVPLPLDPPGMPDGLLPLALTALVVLIGCWALASLSARHAGLARLYELSDALAASSGSRDPVDSVLRESARLMRVRYAELVLAGLEPDPMLRWVLRSPTGEVEPAPVYSWLGRRPLLTAGILGGRGMTASERAYLRLRGVRHAMFVPLQVDDTVTGHLLVADRSGGKRRFGADDLRLLQAAANHASLALRTARLIERLHAESRHDELTGLPNRLAFRELLDVSAAAAAAPGGSPCTVMVLDFDGFKAINDTLGHPAGDELLRVLAQRLRATAAQDAVVARLGGDEFAVLSTSYADAGTAHRLAARLLAVFDEPVEAGGARLRLGGSMGIAIGPQHGSTGSELMRTADIAMYAAKSSSDGARMFSADLVELTASSLILASDLRDAIDRDEIGVVVQPLVDLATGAVHSVEVLARWTHPQLGEIAPEDFFAAAERSGQVAALSSRVLDRALELCRDWQQDGRPLRVAVNLATRWLGDPGLPEQVEAALARHGVPADLLCLELTESGAMAEPRRSVRTLARLRELGVRLSVDDFGTGSSSLTFLSRLPVDQIKIDTSFVLRVGDSADDRAIVQSILDLGRNLGLEVVAEGVTDGAGRAALRQMGCRLAQGYLFSRPLPAEELGAVLRSLAGLSNTPPLAALLPGATLS